MYLHCIQSLAHEPHQAKTGFPSEGRPGVVSRSMPRSNRGLVRIAGCPRSASARPEGWIGRSRPDADRGSHRGIMAEVQAVSMVGGTIRFTVWPPVSKKSRSRIQNLRHPVRFRLGSARLGWVIGLENVCHIPASGMPLSRTFIALPAIPARLSKSSARKPYCRPLRPSRSRFRSNPSGWSHARNK